MPTPWGREHCDRRTKLAPTTHPSFLPRVLTAQFFLRLHHGPDPLPSASSKRLSLSRGHVPPDRAEPWLGFEDPCALPASQHHRKAQNSRGRGTALAAWGAAWPPEIGR